MRKRMRKREILDKDIIKWNRRLDSSSYQIGNGRGFQWPPELRIFQKVNQMGGINQMVQTLDPHITYKFSFSVSINRVDHFWKISSELINRGIDGTFVYDSYDSSNQSNLTFPLVAGKRGNQNLTYEITPDPKFEVTHEDHEYVGRKFRKYTYTFNDKLTKIMSFIILLEDTISIFEDIWGYDKDGNEICLLKYPIGSIVSKVDDKSSDYIVLDYKYTLDIDKYTISYMITSMETKEGSPVIKYGDVENASEKQICHSRNQRIDDILNN